MRQIFTRFRYFFATVLFLLTTAMSSGGAVFAYSLTNPNNDYKKVYVCKYVGTPGVDERLQTGTNPISVDTNSLSGFTGLGSFFNDGQVRSVAIAWDTGDKIEPPVSMCPQPNNGPTEVRPTTPLATTPTCDEQSMTVTPPTITGIIWSPAVATTLQPTDSVTYTASADTANGFALAANAPTTFSFTNNFDDSNCPKPPTLVTPLTPTKTTPNCEVQSMTVTPPTITGIIWSPAGATTLQPGQSITYDAYADTANGYALAPNATTRFSFTNNFDPAVCNCGCENTVTPGDVTFSEACGITNDTYTIPATEHVRYYINGSLIPANAGTYHITAAGTISVEAVAGTGYTLSGTHSWTHNFTDAPCIIKVRPLRVIFRDLCEVKNDTFIIPSKTGVEYQINGQPIAAGTYDAHDYAVNGSVTVTAIALSGYQLKGKQHTWTKLFTNEPCEGGGGGGQTTPVTPAAATFTEVCETANDTYTVPVTTGVTYKVNGVVTPAGTYPATGTVTITAEPQMGYVLDGTTSWTHTFTNEPCAGAGGQVLGESTVVFTPGGKGGEAPVQSAQLANTGQNSLVSSLVAVFIVTSALLVYAFNPKRKFA